MSVAYIVSRFPHFSETFIVRELEAVAARGAEVELLSLFASRDRGTHPAAARWTARLRRPSARAGMRAVARWALRRPLRLASVLATVALTHRRAPRVLVRALATVPLALAHATTVQRLGIRHVHAHYATYPTLAAWVVFRMTGCPYSFTAHAHDLYVDRSMLCRKLGDATFAVPISRFNRRLLESECPATATPLHVVHCGVDPSAVGHRARTLPAQGPVRALCVASLQEYKGHRYLLDALAAPGEVGRIELDLIGDGPLRPALEEQASRLGLRDRVRFLGVRDEGAVTGALAAADLFVLPSVVGADGQMEGIPVALMEAMSAGVPVVTTRISGIPELVRHDETGLLAEPGDPRSLATMLAAALADPAATAARGIAARRVVEQDFTLAEQGRRMAQLLAAACAGAPARRSQPS